MMAEETLLVLDASGPTAGRIGSPWDTLVCFLPRSIPRAYAHEYPMIEYVCFFNATGGMPEDPNLELYDEDAEHRPLCHFDRLTEKLDTVIAAGFRPYLALSGSPVKLARDATAISPAFGCNTSPPADWGRYDAFVEALFDHLSASYGTAEVAKWRFRCMTEPDNRNWWTGSREEWFEFYRHTVSAAGRANASVRISPGNFIERRTPWLSAYASLVQSQGFRTTTGERYVPPMLTFSFYRPWQLGEEGGPLELTHDFAAIRRQLAQFPCFDNVRLGIAEGYVGVDEQGRTLWDRIDGTELGGAYFAMLCKVLVEQNATSAALWEPGSSEVPPPARNVLDLFERWMDGTDRLEVRLTRGTASTRNVVGALAGMNPHDGSVRVMAFNYNKDRGADVPETVHVRIEGLPTARLELTRFVVDRTHANYQPRWFSDSAHLQRENSSPYTMDPLKGLGPKGRELWDANKAIYKTLSDVRPVLDREPASPKEGTLDITFAMTPNSVSLLIARPEPARLR